MATIMGVAVVVAGVDVVVLCSHSLKLIIFNFFYKKTALLSE